MRPGTLCGLAVLLAITASCRDATSPQLGHRWSPDLRSAVLQSGDRIFLAGPDGSNPVYLTTGTNPAWSPDGNRIAFSRFGLLYVIDVDGTNPRALTGGSRPGWSPDGTRLVFTNSSGIAVLDLRTGEATQVIRHDFNPHTYKPWDMGVDKATWSPDGQRIAFEHLGDGDMQPAQIYVTNIDGSGTQLLSQNSPHRYAESDPSWSPDGRQIVHWSYGHGIVLTQVDGGGYRTVYANFPFIAYGSKPEWSPDGGSILFNSYRWAGSQPQLFKISVNGGDVRAVVSNAYSADWSPDGSRIAFVREMSDARWKHKR